MPLLNDARDWLTDQLQHAAGVTVTYVRGVTSLTLTAVVGRTAFSSNDEGGPRLIWGDRDYFVAAADLVFDGRRSEPREGDRIRETIDGVEYVFEVRPTDTGEPAWRWSDPTRGEWRIHTKQVR